MMKVYVGLDQLHVVAVNHVLTYLRTQASLPVFRRSASDERLERVGEAQTRCIVAGTYCGHSVSLPSLSHKLKPQNILGNLDLVCFVKNSTCNNYHGISILVSVEKTACCQGN